MRRWVAARPQPEFILPARFRAASFENFEISAEHPEHGLLVERARRFITDAKPPPRRFWQRGEDKAGDGLFFVGPPGVGKTHLLAAGYVTADVPKLFATFDELVAAAGPLGMAQLTSIVTEPDLVCIDEVVLEDPGNITMLATLLQHMVAAGVHVFATANMPPDEAGGKGGWMQTFSRELGSIASAFDVVRIAGEDHRARRSDDATQRPAPHEGPALRLTWEDLDHYLLETHPMYDAGWLSQVSTLAVTTPAEAPRDKDRALRFVRFIDRVYDRDVQLQLDTGALALDDMVAPLAGDPRYVWHVARGTSRLRELLRAG